MILRGGDYFAQTASPSPLEHTWSLGIEEQFYLVWPLLVAGLLAGTLRSRLVAPRWRTRPAVRHRSGGLDRAAGDAVPIRRPGRAYYGTDTRGGEPAGRCRARGPARRRWSDGETVDRQRSRSSTGGPDRARCGARPGGARPGAGPGRHANGGDRRLYRGGLADRGCGGGDRAGARGARAARLVRARRWRSHPWCWWAGSPTASTCGTGRCSSLSTADRTGLAGLELFAAAMPGHSRAWPRLSYLLVERPDPERRLRVTGGRRRPSSWARRGRRASGTVVALVVVTTACAVTGTSRRGPDVDGRLAAATDGTAAAPILRSAREHRPQDRADARRQRGRAKAVHRHPLAWPDPVIARLRGLGRLDPGQLPAQPPRLDIRGRTLLGCGVARIGPTGTSGRPTQRVGPDCREWPTLWRRAIAADDPDVAFILVGRWETMDRMLDGRWTHVGDPAFDAYLRSSSSWRSRPPARTARESCWPPSRSTGAASSSTAACTPRTSPSGSPPGTRCCAMSRPTTPMSAFSTSVPASPDGQFTWTAGGVQVRSDGLHLTPSGVQDWIAPWLLPQLVRAVR